MKVTIENKNKLEFPKLMKLKDSELIILFESATSSVGCGTVIVEGKIPVDGGTAYKAGNHSDCWSMQNFEDFSGKIILEQ